MPVVIQVLIRVGAMIIGILAITKISEMENGGDKLSPFSF
jgi:hypothetical protein